MTGKLKKAIASLMAVASLSTCAVGISASAAEQGKFNVHYGVGAPSSENVVSESSSSYVPNTDPAITLYCTLASPSSNVTHCNITIPLRESWEGVATISYTGQRKDIDLVTRSTNTIYYTTTLVRNNSSASYGNCHFAGNAY